MAFLEINTARLVIVDGQHRLDAFRALAHGGRDGDEKKKAATTDVTA